MAKNYIQPGNNITIPAPATVASGGVVIAGDLIGIAAGDAAAGSKVDVHMNGVFSVPKVGSDAFTLGAKVYWSGTLATVTASTNKQLGVAVEAAAAGSGSVKVRLLG